jgi:hypothetical protein
MTCLGSPVRPGAIALAATLACSTAPLLAQGAYADPAGSEAAVASGRAGAATAADTPIAPFAVVHPTYVPSPSAVDDQPAIQGSERPRPVRSARLRSRVAAARPAERAPAAPPPAAAPDTEMPAMTETPAAVGPPPVTMPRQAAPAAIGRPRPALPPTGTTPIDGDDARVLAAGAGAGAAIVLGGAGFLLWRRNRRRANFAGAVAKTPTWQAVMPPDLAGVPGETIPPPDETVASSPGKRVKRGQSSDHAGPVAAKRHDAPTVGPALARGPRVVEL